MVFAQGLLAAICVVLGHWRSRDRAPCWSNVAASVLHPYGGVFAAEGMELMNQYSGAATSTPAIAIALVVLVGLACGYRKLKTVGKVQKSQPWACGYAPNEHMPSWPPTFASEVSWFMQPLYTLRDRCTAVCWSIAHFFQKLTGVAEAVEPVPDKVLVDAPHKGVEKLADLATKLEGGQLQHLYLLYRRGTRGVPRARRANGLRRGEHEQHRTCRSAGRGRHGRRTVLLRVSAA